MNMKIVCKLRPPPGLRIDYQSKDRPLHVDCSALRIPIVFRARTVCLLFCRHRFVTVKNTFLSGTHPILGCTARKYF